MGSIFVVIGLSIWTVVMATAVVAPLILGIGKSAPTITAVADKAPGSPAPTNAAPVRLRSDDRAAA